jgi:phosphoribosyl 1,2-cyclic phosphodiesterase
VGQPLIAESAIKRMDRPPFASAGVVLSGHQAAKPGLPLYNAAHLDITFWGTRGSIASPGPETLHYGGNTSCVSVESEGQVFVFDCGTGARLLGNHMLKSRAAGLDLSLFISHCHWDHIQGFPFFGPLFGQGNACTIYAPQEQNQRLKNTLAGQMQYRYFPVELDHLSAAIRYQELREDSFTAGSASVKTRYLHHTTVTMGYRLEVGGRCVVYATDTEPYAQRVRAWADPEKRQFGHPQDEDLAEFFRGADVLIMDSQYTPDEYPSRVTWGHGTYDYALDLAMSAGVKTLVLYHHDPMRNDLGVEGILQACWQRVAREGSPLVVAAAAEGMTLSLPDQVGPVFAPQLPTMPLFRHHLHIALVGLEDDMVALADKALTEPHYDVRRFEHIQALNGDDLHEFHPHILLIQARHAHEAAEIKQQLRRVGHYSRLPVVLLMPDASTLTIEETFDEGVSDVVVWPFTASQLRARVESWLFRGGVALDRRAHPRPRANASAQPIAVSA